MQIGIDSFAAAFDEASLAISPSDRVRHLVEQIEHATRWVWTARGATPATIQCGRTVALAPLAGPRQIVTFP